MKVVAVIPIKLNNERLPNKNTKMFSNGKPLCSYIFETLKKSKYIDQIYVFCSNEKIKEYLIPGITFLRRNEDLDTNTTTMNDILKAFIDKVDATIYVLAHTTAPFISVNSFDTCIDKLIYENYDSAFSVIKKQEFLWRNGVPLNYDLENIPRSQDLPLIYQETCGFYIFKKDVMKNKNRRIGDRPYLYEVTNLEATDINTSFDFEIADFLSKKYEEGENEV